MGEQGAWEPSGVPACGTYRLLLQPAGRGSELALKETTILVLLQKRVPAPGLGLGSLGVGRRGPGWMAAITWPRLSSKTAALLCARQIQVHNLAGRWGGAGRPVFQRKSSTGRRGLLPARRLGPKSGFPALREHLQVSTSLPAARPGDGHLRPVLPGAPGAWGHGSSSEDVTSEAVTPSFCT